MLLWFALQKRSLENIFGDASQADHNHFAVPEEKHVVGKIYWM